VELACHVAPAEKLAEENERLKSEIESLKAEIERLRRLLEEALRAGKRQAAPFSRREPKAHPQKPGRKAGERYGRNCRRPIPRKIDERVEVPLPERCPHCGGGVEEEEIVSQYQTEIPKPSSGLGHEVELAAGRVPCFRGELVGLQGKFSHCIRNYC